MFGEFERYPIAEVICDVHAQACQRWPPCKEKHWLAHESALANRRSESVNEPAALVFLHTSES